MDVSTRPSREDAASQMEGHSFIQAEAKYYSMRKTKDGIVVGFVIHPNDFSAELALAPIGTRVLLAIAEISDEQPQEDINHG